MSDPPSPAAAKASLRREAASARGRVHREAGAAAAAALRDAGLAALSRYRFGTVAGYVPIRSEIDPMPLLAALAAAGHDLALPAVIGRGEALLFRRWRIGEPLVGGPLGTAHPPADAGTVRPELVLVPLLAFDRRRHRLGYGAGYYDRTLRGLREERNLPPEGRAALLAVGIAYAAQEVPAVPVDEWDAPLDLVLTERGIV